MAELFSLSFTSDGSMRKQLSYGAYSDSGIQDVALSIPFTR